MHLEKSLVANLALTATAYAMPAAVQNNSQTRQVVTTHGPVFTEYGASDKVISYKGIPYAAPPVKEMRWRAPISPTSWSEPLNATSFGPQCISFLEGGSPIPAPQSEDCLLANVWAPSNIPDGDSRPVMVWVHGGGFEFDSALNAVYDGTHYAERGIVLVSFDYRLGNLGFLAREDLDAESKEYNSGNFGLQDQLLALKWVRENIKAFGGDPENVTIFGESAGAHAIGILMASPQAHGLFDKAILQSGAWWDSEHGSLSTFDEAREMGAKWGKRFGSNVTPADLRALPVSAIVNSSLWGFDQDPGATVFAPNIDGFVVPDVPAKAFVEGTQVKVPLLASWNQDEGTLFVNRYFANATAATLPPKLESLFDIPGKNKHEVNRELKRLYPACNDTQANASALAVAGDLVIAQQTWQAVHLHSQTSGLRDSTFASHFIYTSPYNPVAGHASDLNFDFGTLQVPNSGSMAGGGGGAKASEKDEEVSDSIMQYWVNFASTGNPNGDGLPEWPVYVGEKAKGGKVLEIGEEIHVPEYDFGRFEFIAGYRTDGVLPVVWRSLKP